MRFATLQGCLAVESGIVRFSAILDRAGGITTVGERVVADDIISDDMVWLVDQLTQELIGTDLAEAGWEVVAVDNESATHVGRTWLSDVWTLRNLGYQ